MIERSYRFRAERFAQFSIPTLLLLGGDSPPVFRRAIDVVAAALPTNRIAVMPGQQHVAMDTAPELFLKEVIAFLSGPAAAAGGAGTFPGRRSANDTLIGGFYGVGQPGSLGIGVSLRRSGSEDVYPA